MNLWHDIDPGESEKMTVVIEIPRGSNNKYEIDKASGLIKLDRVLYSAQTFPFDYGFVPKTLWDDNDALDVILLTTNPLFPGLLVEARPVGIMGMIDNGEQDDKVIAVPTNDPRWAHAKDIGDLNVHTVKEIEHFFATYKILQKKDVSVTGFSGAAEARAAFKRARKLYDDKFKK